jgi:hypothetical protein
MSPCRREISTNPVWKGERVDKTTAFEQRVYFEHIDGHERRYDIVLYKCPLDIPPPKFRGGKSKSFCVLIRTKMVI